jgi:hypothetical protein
MASRSRSAAAAALAATGNGGTGGGPMPRPDDSMDDFNTSFEGDDDNDGQQLHIPLVKPELIVTTQPHPSGFLVTPQQGQPYIVPSIPLAPGALTKKPPSLITNDDDNEHHNDDNDDATRGGSSVVIATPTRINRAGSLRRLYDDNGSGPGPNDLLATPTTPSILHDGRLSLSPSSANMYTLAGSPLPSIMTPIRRPSPLLEHTTTGHDVSTGASIMLTARRDISGSGSLSPRSLAPYLASPSPNDIVVGFSPTLPMSSPTTTTAASSPMANSQPSASSTTPTATTTTITTTPSGTATARQSSRKRVIRADGGSRLAAPRSVATGSPTPEQMVATNHNTTNSSTSTTTAASTVATTSSGRPKRHRSSPTLPRPVPVV